MRSSQIVAWGAGAGVARALPALSERATCSATSSWPGWAGIKYAFTFGDSYTTTSFNYTGMPAPSATNPLGNPPYPGWNAANGPNWVDLVTVKYNASLVLTYNLADGGAAVDSALVAPWKPEVRSIKQQVNDVFLPGYAASPASARTAASPPSWTGADSLFAVWIGINDVGNSYWKGAAETKTLFDSIFGVYRASVAALVGAGARNLVFVNVPPVDRSPLMLGQSADARDTEKVAISDWNARVAALAAETKQGTAAANVWLVDSHDLFTKALDDPKAFAQTAGYKNTTAFCNDYQNGTPQQDTLSSACAIPVNQYFWLNSLHPTYPMHDVVAQQTVALLKAGPNVC